MKAGLGWHNRCFPAMTGQHTIHRIHPSIMNLLRFALAFALWFCPVIASASSTVIIEENFEEEESLGIFTQVSVTSNFTWRWRENNFDGRFVEMNGFNADEASDDWLILAEPLNLSDYENPIARFKFIVNFGGPDIEFVASSDYDPNVHADPGAATWTPVPFFEEGSASEPDKGGWGSQFSEVVDLSGVKGESVYLGFHYVSVGTESGDGSVWRIDDFSVSDSDPDAIIINSPLTAELDPWTIVDVAGPDTWELSFFGDREGIFIDGSFSEQPNEDWLISPPLTVGEDAIPLLSLDFYTELNGLSLQALVSTDYDAAVHANPNEATWTPIHMDFATPDAETWTTFSGESLYGLAGDALHVALKYTSAGGDPPIAKVQGVSNVCLFTTTQAPALSASITADQTQVTSSQDVKFTALGRGGKRPYTYTWDFGDAGSSTEADPVHAFANAGTYTVGLTIIDALGAETTVEAVDLVEVVNPENVFLNFDFEGPEDEDVPEPWHVANIRSDAEWLIQMVGGRTGAVMSGFNTDEASEDWLISPNFEIVAADQPVLSVDVYWDFDGPPLEVFVSPDYEHGDNPNDATWINLNADLASLPEEEWTTVAGISLVGLEGNYALAFQYTSTGTASGQGRTYGIDNVRVINEAATPPFTDLTIGATKTEITNEEPGAFFVRFQGGKHPYEYAWTFGDGSTSNAANPTPVFVTPGTFDVTLAVTDANGERLEITAPDAFTVIDAASILLEQDFEGFDDDFIAEPWVTYSVTSNADWLYDTWDGQQGAFINGFGADEASDDWLISPPITVAEGESASVSFDFFTGFSGGGFEVSVSTGYDPNVDDDVESVEWTPIRTEFGGDDWSRVSNLAIPRTGEGIRIGFHYLSDGTEAGDGRRIGIDQVRVTKSTLPPAGDFLLSGDFSGAENGPLPDGWNAVSVASDADWQLTERDGRVGALINGFGADAASDDWLVSPPVALGEDLIPVLSFGYYARFNGADVEVLVSSNYDPATHNDPAQADWTNVSPNFSNIADSEWTVLDGISLAGITGEAVHIAFHYVSTGTEAGDGRLIGIDDVQLTDAEALPPLEISLTQTPNEVELGNALMVDAAAQGGRRPYTFTWDFGDGAMAEGATASHTYDEPGEFTITLIGRDASGSEANAEATVTVISLGDLVINTTFAEPFPGDGWTAIDVASDAVWELQTWEDREGAFINGFGADGPSEDWLVSPPFDVDFWGMTTLSFDFYQAFDGPPLEVLISGDIDPENPESLTSAFTAPIEIDFAAIEERTWTPVRVDLAGFAGRQCRLAFRYVTEGTEGGQGRRIGINNVRVQSILPPQPAPETYTFDEWKAVNGYFKAGDPRGALDQDPDGDGLTNNVEHRFLLDPTKVGGLQNLPQVSLQEGKLLIRFTRMREEEPWTVQLSDDLETWVNGVEGQDISTTASEQDVLGDVTQFVEVTVIGDHPYARLVLP